MVGRQTSIYGNLKAVGSSPTRSAFNASFLHRCRNFLPLIFAIIPSLGFDKRDMTLILILSFIPCLMHSFKIDCAYLPEVLENLLAILFSLGVSTAKILITVSVPLLSPFKYEILPPWIAGDAESVVTAAGPREERA